MSWEANNGLLSINSVLSNEAAEESVRGDVPPSGLLPECSVGTEDSSVDDSELMTKPLLT